MKKGLLAAALLLSMPYSALADNVGGCGLGSKLFNGSHGVVPQVFAVTTNGSFGNQTFGISTGTLGCTQDGVVNSNWKTAMFIDANRPMLAKDMSEGQGETLDSLAQLLGVEQEHKAAFFAAAKNNFQQIFPTSSTSSDNVLANLNSVLASDALLARYAHS